MGVPAFFQWLKERYPTMMHEVLEGDSLDKVEKNCAEDAGRVHVQCCDNMYLDLNGIVHPCCHPEDGQPLPKTEEEMLRRIEAHLDRLMELMRPRKFVYFALDGVAPRAKMNQQRTRRYVGAQERAQSQGVEQEMREEMVREGRAPPAAAEAKWDHNVITPGTEFMRKLATYLRGYCARRAAKHPRWATISFALSDATVPGEGEHKIISYVRALRQQPGYDPTTRHCIVGEDADLIMLSLALHEESFCVLRKRMKWDAPDLDQDVAAEVGGSGNPSANWALGQDEQGIPDAAPFGYHIVQIDVLRGYLKASLGDCPLTKLMPPNQVSDYHERIIDDFVFLCFFCGNDFLPHLPSFDIREGALDVIFELYRRRQAYVNQLGDALLTNAGTIIPSKTAAFLVALAEIEAPIFERRAKRNQRMALPKNQMDCREFMQRGACKYGDACEFKHGDHCPRDKANANLRLEILDFCRSDETEKALSANLASGARKKAHAISEEFGLDHLSEGDGADRHLVLRKGANFCPDRFPSKSEEVKPSADPKVTADAFKEELKKRIVDRAGEAHTDNSNAVGLGEGPGWRERYYRIKLKADDELVGDICREYWKGLQWVLSYYYAGCQSWRFYYDQHYAPFAVDLAAHAPLAPPHWSDPAEPFKPLAQLLAVIPSGSAHCLPPACRLVMDVPVDSPSSGAVAGAKRAKDLVGPSGLEELFPTKINMDPNGRKHQWEWVALLPFMDERQLELVLDCMSDTFDASELDRNRQTKALAGMGAGCAEPPFDIKWLGLSKSDEPPYQCFEEPTDLQRHVCRPLAAFKTQTPLTGAVGRETEPVWTPGRPAGRMGDSGELRRRPRMTLGELESAGRMLRHQGGVDARLQQLQQQSGWQPMQGGAQAYGRGPPGGGGYHGGGGMRANAPAYGGNGGYNAPPYGGGRPPHGGGYNGGYNGGGGMRANAPAYGGGPPRGYNGGYNGDGGMRANAPSYGGAPPPYLHPGGLQANHPLLMRRPPPQAYAAPPAYSHGAPAAYSHGAPARAQAPSWGGGGGAPPSNAGYAHRPPPAAANAGAAAALRDSMRGTKRGSPPGPPHDPRQRRK